MAKRDRKSRSPSVSESEEERFQVEVITRAKVTKDRTFEYYVKWAGYDSDDDTWEPYANVRECKRLLRSFWREIGLDKKAKPGLPGTVYSASESWIEDEQGRFRKTAAEEELRRISRKKGKQKELPNDIPLAGASTAAQTQKKKRKSIVPSSDDELDIDDVPLAKLSRRGAQVEKQLTNATADGSKPPSRSSSPNSLFDDVPDHAPPEVAPEVAQESSSSKVTAKAPFVKRPYRLPPKVQLVSHDGLGQIGTRDKMHQIVNSTTTTERNVPQNKYAGMKISKVSKNPSAASSSSQSTATNANKRPISTSADLRATIREYTAVSNPVVMPTLVMPRAAPTSDSVDSFLASIAPDHAVTAQKYEIARDAKNESGKSLLDLKFGKKWKWEGGLFIDRGELSDEKLCDVIISDVSEAAEYSYKFNHLFQADNDRLKLTKIHKVIELNLFMPAFQKVHQFAKLSTKDTDQPEGFKSLQLFLRKGKFVSLVSLKLPNLGSVAEFIIFPDSEEFCCSRLSVPHSMRNADGLIIAILPWQKSPEVFAKQKYREPRDNILALTSDHNSMTRKVSEQAQYNLSYQSALAILAMPDNLLSFLPKRFYCIWAASVEEKPSDQGRDFSKIHRNLREETKALLAVLNRNGAQNVGYKADLRMIFVHVAALRTLTKLPALVERREKRNEIRFYTYGFHHSVDPQYWGIHEIYPVGGVLTFTASALLHDPAGSLKLINKVHQHPLWATFILPSVLADLAFKYYDSLEPFQGYIEEPGLVGKLVDLVQQAVLSLLPAILSSYEDAERTAWTETQIMLSRMSNEEILKYCCDSYSTAARKGPQEYTTTNDIAMNLSSLHVQPAIRKSYRRFAVIKSREEAEIPYDKDGFEWKTLDEFDFRDNFYPKAP